MQVSLRTEYLQDHNHAQQLLTEAGLLSIEAEIREGFVVFRCMLHSDDSVDALRERIWALTHRSTHFYELDMCYKSLNAGSEPDMSWFTKYSPFHMWWLQNSHLQQSGLCIGCTA